MKRVFHKLARLTRYVRLFRRVRDMAAYYRCRHTPFVEQPVALQVRQLPVSLL